MKKQNTAMDVPGINWGMIGTGDVTERKSGPAFNKVEGSRLVAVFNRSHEKALDYAARHRIGTVCKSAGELISDERINAVYIATPPDAHPLYAIQALEAGKAVYVEKPMATTYADCMRMNRASERTGNPLYVAYYRRSLDYFNKVRELVDQAVLGRVHSVHTILHMSPRPGDRDPDHLPWRVIPAVSGGGYFHDMACHQLDILVYLLGRFAGISGRASNRAGLYGPPDTVTACGLFEAGIPYSASWCFACAENSSRDEMVLTGDKGSLEFSCFSFTPINLRTGRETRTFSITNPVNIQYPMIRAVTLALQGRGESPSTGVTGAYTSWLMEEIIRA
jgi:1,5-anhydro-D-fructose reductase (1,5-anhydro-D-mannitol-forming)